MEKEDPQKLVLTVAEAGKLLRISRGASYAAIRSGRLKSVRIGKRILVPFTAIERLLEEVNDGD